MYPSSLIFHENVNLDDIIVFTDGEPPVQGHVYTSSEKERDRKAMRGSGVFYNEATLMFSLEHDMKTVKEVKESGHSMSGDKTWDHENSHFIGPSLL